LSLPPRYSLEPLSRARARPLQAHRACHFPA